MNLPASTLEETAVTLGSGLVGQIEALCSKYPEDRRQSAVIPALWLAQKEHQGWLPQAVLCSVADLLKMPRIRVHEIASFYTMFNLQPVGKWLLQVCGTPPCALQGAEGLKNLCEREIGPANTVSPDGRLSWMEVECLGACVDAPVIQINDIYHENLDEEKLLSLLEHPESWEPPVRERGGKGTLTDSALYDGSRSARLASIPGAPAEKKGD